MVRADVTSPTCALSKYSRIMTDTVLLSTFTCFYRYYYYHSVTLTFDLWPWIFAMRQLRWAKQVYLLCLCLWSLTSNSQWPPQKLSEKKIPAPYSPAVDEFASSRPAPPFAVLFLVSLKKCSAGIFPVSLMRFASNRRKNGQHPGWKIPKLQPLCICDVHKTMKGYTDFDTKFYLWRQCFRFLMVRSYASLPRQTQF